MMELQAIHDTRQSFYKKAMLNITDNENALHIELLSYNTIVANFVEYKKENKCVYEYFGNYSQTTTRHQKEFFKQMGLNDKEIKELFKNGRLEK